MIVGGAAVQASHRRCAETVRAQAGDGSDFDPPDARRMLPSWQIEEAQRSPKSVASRNVRSPIKSTGQAGFRARSYGTRALSVHHRLKAFRPRPTSWDIRDFISADTGRRRRIRTPSTRLLSWLTCELSASTGNHDFGGIEARRMSNAAYAFSSGRTTKA